ncbi:transposase [Bacillus massiliigorillae]|uniref:transposase n=1 Tax=Bacillus massiliigorillae TaxID=1243664 RepID=UPI0018A842DD
MIPYNEPDYPSLVISFRNIDDFAIRKGHSYNTELHNLRGDSPLDIIHGRKTPKPKTYSSENPTLLSVRPVAVVIDLSNRYHTFICSQFGHKHVWYRPLFKNSV